MKKFYKVGPILDEASAGGKNTVKQCEFVFNVPRTIKVILGHGEFHPTDWRSRGTNRV